MRKRKTTCDFVKTIRWNTSIHITLLPVACGFKKSIAAGDAVLFGDFGLWNISWTSRSWCWSQFRGCSDYPPNRSWPTPIVKLGGLHSQKRVIRWSSASKFTGNPWFSKALTNEEKVSWNFGDGGSCSSSAQRVACLLSAKMPWEVAIQLLVRICPSLWARKKKKKKLTVDSEDRIWGKPIQGFEDLGVCTTSRVI